MTTQEERFQPEINRNSEKILEHSEKFAGKDFFDRQAELLERKLSLCNRCPHTTISATGARILLYIQRPHTAVCIACAYWCLVLLLYY